MGPCVVGARVGADTASSKVTSWSAGINYTRMTAADGVVERLIGQQVGGSEGLGEGGDGRLLLFTVAVAACVALLDALLAGCCCRAPQCGLLQCMWGYVLLGSAVWRR